MEYLFDETKEELEERIQKLSSEIMSLYSHCREAFSGGDGWHSSGFRYLEQERLSKEVLRRQYLRVERHLEKIPVPASPEAVFPGTVVHLESQARELSRWVLCFPLDVEMLSSRGRFHEAKLVSVESEFGRAILGKRVGDVVQIRNSSFRIMKI